MSWIFLLLSLGAQAADPPAIVEIRSHWTAVQKAIEAKEFYVAEINYNADNTPYAAIGIMRSKIRIFRLCDAETDPYPQNQAVEIIHDSAYSAYSFHAEYLYDSKGNLQFAFQTHADQTIRLYWKDSNLLRVMAADKTYDDPNSVPEHISDVAVGIKMAGESLQNLARQTLAKDVSYVTWAP